MKALVLEEHSVFAFKDVPDPEIGPDDVLIAVAACGICGSDVHGMDGSTGRRRTPLIMGHEASGTITDIGANVTGWKKDDRVTFDSTVYCGECPYCRAGTINLCDNRQVLGVAPAEYSRQGAYAEFVVVPQRILYKLPDNRSFAHAAFVEPISVAVHAVSLLPITKDTTAVVIGSGMIGLLIVQALHAAGCQNVIAVDIVQEKLDLATTLGAKETLNANDCDVAAEVYRLTDGFGADVALEVVGNSATVQSAIKCLRKGGSLSFVGNLSSTIELPLQHIITHETKLYGSCASSGEYPECLDLMDRGIIDVEPLISAIAPLADGESWFKRLYNNEPGLMKVILAPNGELE